MAITIDGITLPDLVMENEFSRSMVEARTARTLGGKMNIWEQAVSGRNIDLAGGDDFGLITREVLQQLLDLSAAANAFYILSYEGAVYTVRFRHEDGAPIEATPVVARPNQEDGDWYNNVRIKLMEV